MTTSSYLNLFLDADITWEPDKEKYSRCLDALLAQEPITLEDIVGIGERSDDLIPVGQRPRVQAHQRGDGPALCPGPSLGRFGAIQGPGTAGMGH